MAKVIFVRLKKRVMPSRVRPVATKTQDRIFEDGRKSWAKEHWKPLEGRKGKETFSPAASSRNAPLPTPWCRPNEMCFGLRTSRTVRGNPNSFLLERKLLLIHYVPEHTDKWIPQSRSFPTYLGFSGTAHMFSSAHWLELCGWTMRRWCKKQDWD